MLTQGRSHSVLLIIALSAALSSCATGREAASQDQATAASSAAAPPAPNSAVGAVVPGVSVVEGAAVGAAISGLSGAVWADSNNDGYVDGYVINGQFYSGTPATAAPVREPAGGTSWPPVPPPSPPSPPSPPAPPPPPPPAIAERNGGIETCSDLPQLSLTPPRPSASPLTLNNRRFRRRGATLASVAEELMLALGEAEYEEYGYYCVPGGFALATAIERIRPDKSPYPGDARWIYERTPLLRLEEGFSLRRLLRAITSADPGRYRMIVFYVTNRRVVPLSSEPGPEFQNLPRAGPDEVPEDFETIPYSADHRVRAFVYEFRRPSVSGAARFVAPTLPTTIHLRRAGILPSLER